MYSQSVLTKCIRRSLAAVALGACAVAMPAMAAGTGQAQQGQNAEELKTITVTGTLIRQSDVAPASPVTRVTHQQIEASGFQDIGQLLNNLPSVGYSMGIQTGSFYGTGATRINLRYLGSNRLLVLLNGKRFVSSFGGSVDLTQIPLSIVDHIEILQDGASATYGFRCGRRSTAGSGSGRPRSRCRSSTTSKSCRMAPRPPTVRTPSPA